MPHLLPISRRRLRLSSCKARAVGVVALLYRHTPQVVERTRNALLIAYLALQAQTLFMQGPRRHVVALTPATFPRLLSEDEIPCLSPISRRRLRLSSYNTRAAALSP
jgi:hypothetical protein